MSRLVSAQFAPVGRPLAFSMDGDTYTALEGETIAAALIAGGRANFKRDKHGQPRGLSCGMGACFECEVSINGDTPVRACLTKVVEGMLVTSVDYRRPSPAPAASDGASSSDFQEFIDCTVLVVGAGPAGMSAALTLADSGISVVVVDERGEPGGQYLKPLAGSQAFIDDVPADAQYAEGIALSQRLRDASVRCIAGATVWGVFKRDDGGFEAGVVGPNLRAVVRAEKLILATGAFESVPAFPGWTLPGVMTTGAAQGLARAYRVAPGHRVLIAGNGPLNLQLACELLAGGVQVLAVAESAPNPYLARLVSGLGLLSSAPALALRGARYLATLRRRGVPVLFGQHIARASGVARVECATLAALGPDGRLGAGTEQEFAVDAVCLGYGLQASNELARALGCEHVPAAAGVLSPVRGVDGASSVPGVFIVGDSGVLGGAHVAQAEGRMAARAIIQGKASDRSTGSVADERLLGRHRAFQRHLWSFYKAPEYVPQTPEALICRCESVSVATVSALIAEGLRDFGSIKRCTRVGMGSCQGRYCQRQLAKLVTDLTGVMPAANALFEPRSPAKPVVIGRLAVEKPEWAGYRSIDGAFAPPGGTGTAATARLEAEVLVIGAGVIGLSTALHLAKAGVDVLVVDSGSPFAQASGTNAGSLHGQLLSSDFASQTSGAGPALALQRLGIAEWQALETLFAADFEMALTGGLVVAGCPSEMAFLERKVALEQQHGLDVELLGQAALRTLLPAVSPRMLGAAYCKGEGKINPLAAAPVILSAVRAAGARVLTPCAVAAIEGKRRGYNVVASAGHIHCNKIVNAAGGWAAGIAALLGAALPVRTAPQQMIVTEPLQATIGLLVAAAQRHLTLKQVANGNVIIGGGWPAGFDRERGRAVNLRESIEGNLWIAQHVIPGLSGVRMLRSWATVGVMIDGAPIVGELPGQPGFFNVVGANGYTMGPILGRITAELVLGKEPPLDLRPFLLERFT